MNNTRKFDGDRIAAVEAIKETLRDCCGICMEPTLNQYTDYKMQIDWHPQEHRRKDGTTYYHLAQKADDLFKPAYQAYGMCDITTLIRAVDDIYAKYNELEAKYQEQCKMISEYEEDKQKTDKLMLEFQERYYDAEKQLKEVKADNEDLECQLNSNYLAKKLADEQITRAILEKENVELKERLLKTENRYANEYYHHRHIETLQKLKSLRDLLESEGVRVVARGHALLGTENFIAKNDDWSIMFEHGRGTCSTVAQLENEIEKLKWDCDILNEKYEEQKRRNSNLAQKNEALGQHIATLCDRVHKMKKNREEYIFEPVTKDKVNCAFCKFEDALGIDIGPMDADVVWRANRILKGIYDLKDKSSYVQFDCPFHTNPEDGI